MDASELATKMLEWEKNKRALDTLGAEIEAEVVKVGKTQVVGKCRVRYSDGRCTYDYQTPCKTVDGVLLAKHAIPVDTTDWKAVAAEVPEVVSKFTVRDFSYDWKAILKEAGLEPIVVSKTEPSATIMLE